MSTNCWPLTLHPPVNVHYGWMSINVHVFMVMFGTKMGNNTHIRIQQDIIHTCAAVRSNSLVMVIVFKLVKSQAKIYLVISLLT